MSLISKPMLAATIKNIKEIQFPLEATPKIDGIRCLVIDGKAVSRSFKPIGNDYIRTWIETNIPDGMDGEILAGKTFNETSGNVRRSEGKPEFLFIIFDYVKPGTSLTVPYVERIQNAEKELESLNLGSNAMLLKPHKVSNESELLKLEEEWLAQGYEGAMLRRAGSPYKLGRATMKTQDLMKLKRFTDAEARVVGFEERKRNDNIAVQDAFGRSKRSSHQENKIGKGTLGAIIAERSDGMVFNIGTGMDEAMLQEIWDNQEKYLGQLVKYKYFEIGTKERPRHPVFLGFRDPSDI